MKFALVNGQREEARPNLSGDCPGCGCLMVQGAEKSGFDTGLTRGIDFAIRGGRTKRNGIALGKTSFPLIGKSLSNVRRP